VDPTKIEAVRLQIYVWPDAKSQPESKPILTIHGNVDTQQQWLKAATEYRSGAKPFQFVVRAWLPDLEASRVAVDDMSYGVHCTRMNIPHHTHRPPTTP